MKSSQLALAVPRLLAGFVILLAGSSNAASVADDRLDSADSGVLTHEFSASIDRDAEIDALMAGDTPPPSEPPAPSGSPAPSDPPDRPLGSAFFGGEGGPRVFGPVPDPAGGDSNWPDLSKPGPDMGDFPNSAFTLPKGRMQIEFSPVTLANADRQSPAAYIAPYLLRYGMTDDVEFRIFGNGVTHVWGPSPTTGFSPLNLDLKIHLWNDRREWLIPAMSLEVFLLTPWGSSQFTGGWQPSLNLNFDLPITKKINLEWTLGYSEVQEAININTHERFIPRFNFLVPGIHRTFDRNFNQFAAQWAVEYEVNDKFQLFAHGFHNGSILLNLGAGDMVGIGGFWKFSPRLMGFGSINTGLTPNLPSCAGQIGIALAL
jgi:hypothetical protein